MVTSFVDLPLFPLLLLTATLLKMERSFSPPGLKMTSVLEARDGGTKLEFCYLYYYKRRLKITNVT